VSDVEVWNCDPSCDGRETIEIPEVSTEYGVLTAVVGEVRFYHQPPVQTGGKVLADRRLSRLIR
jgi:hypothetical protein